MMEEEQLGKHNFLSMTGGYSIRKNNREVIDSLQYTADLLKDNRNMVMLFPQGRLTSLYNRNFLFERGLDYILRQSPGKINVVFVVNLVEYLSNQKPSLFIYFSEYKGILSREEIQESYESYYSDCVSENIITAESC